MSPKSRDICHMRAQPHLHSLAIQLADTAALVYIVCICAVPKAVSLYTTARNRGFVHLYFWPAQRSALHRLLLSCNGLTGILPKRASPVRGDFSITCPHAGHVIGI